MSAIIVAVLPFAFLIGFVWLLMRHSKRDPNHVSAFQRSQVIPESDNDSEVWECSYCGSLNDAGEVDCHKCGASCDD